eukprot:TRINITY_DN74533_c0_g1_i1.p1 TRINITY_DN74533_c0_g1~~TRINITY_DN74533_c0_g1_i1.p1  ORF type:complete len:248 (-),score=49.38 TRINITY_DN74533_c0_g1_i1:62-772(-)
MGNALARTQQFACGHTSAGQLQTSLLADRLSRPTAEMVEALLVLQKRTDMLQSLAESSISVSSPGSGKDASRPMLLLATAYCILFGYKCESAAQKTSTTLCGSDPQQPNDFLVAFEMALRRPHDFLQDLLALRAQVVPREKLMSLLPLLEDGDLSPNAFDGSLREVLRPLVEFLRAAVQCAEIYSEIRESVAAGRTNRREAAALLDEGGAESDQRRAIGAIGAQSQICEEDGSIVE